MVHVFAWFLFWNNHKRKIYEFQEECFMWYGMYEHVWVTKLAKCCGFTASTILPCHFPQFLDPFLSSIWMQYFSCLYIHPNLKLCSNNTTLKFEIQWLSRFSCRNSPSYASPTNSRKVLANASHYWVHIGPKSWSLDLKNLEDSRKRCWLTLLFYQDPFRVSKPINKS